MCKMLGDVDFEQNVRFCCRLAAGTTSNVSQHFMMELCMQRRREKKLCGTKKQEDSTKVLCDMCECLSRLWAADSYRVSNDMKLHGNVRRKYCLFRPFCLAWNLMKFAFNVVEEVDPIDGSWQTVIFLCLRAVNANAHKGSFVVCHRSAFALRRECELQQTCAANKRERKKKKKRLLMIFSASTAILLPFCTLFTSFFFLFFVHCTVRVHITVQMASNNFIVDADVT